MKSVLISINPKWCELIASDKKTVEVRKTKPKLDVPFKCYIYETKGKLRWCNKCHDPDCERPYPNCACHEGWGKVIGEFVCDKIEKIFQCNSGWVQEHACISREEYFKYLGLPYNSHFDSNGAYAWHISDLKIYDKPRELSEFMHECNGICLSSTKHYKCEWFDKKGLVCDRLKPITRPPQSWCYVEGRLWK